MATVAPEQEIIPDDQASDVDSALGDARSDEDSTASLASSILKYRIENGRTYHSYKDGKYNMPNDEAEKNRLDLQHHLFLLSFDGRLGLSPPNDKDAKVRRVLDVGTGTGIWATDYGDEHPEAEIIGVDLSPIQASFVPPNVSFQIDDLEESWTFSKPFDYINSRMMTSSFADWKAYLQQCYDNLEPGGWLELQDVGPLPASDDGSLKPEHNVNKWAQLLGEACYKLGRPYQEVTEYKTLMGEVGFVNIVETKIKWPLNTWPKVKKFKTIGAWSYENFYIGVEAFSMAPFTRGLGWKKEEVDVFVAKVRSELKDRSIHSYFPVFSVYGQKPKKE